MSARGLRTLRLSAVALALLAGAALFNETRHYGLIGYDTYPLIISSRVESFADFAGLFSEQLMDGRYPSAMYRPLTSASFALDYAVFGLDSRGYQATNALIFIAIALALAALGAQLGRKTPGAGKPAGGEWLVLALPALFVLHPSFYEIVPIPARRADLLCAVFTVAAVAAAIAGRRFSAAGAALAAIASKESGFAAPLLVLGATALFRVPASGVLSLVRATMLASLPTIAVALAMLGTRLAVLGGLGGHQGDLSLFGALASVPGIALDLLSGVALVPAARSQLGWVALLLGAGLGVANIARNGAGGSRALGLGALWVATLALTYASAGWVGAWYYMIPALGGCIVFGTLLCCAAATALDARRDGAGRLAAGLGAASLAAAVAWQGSFSPWFYRYSEWERATQVATDFEARLAAKIEAGQPGDAIEAPPLPMWAAPRAGIPGVEGAAVLSDYSVQAWADLVFPGRGIRVSGIEGGVLPLERSPAGGGASTDLRVRLSRRLVGY